MASYVEKISTKTNQPGMYQRMNEGPLDRSSVFSSRTDAEEYAKGAYIADGETTAKAHDSRKLAGTSYVGQIISVYENDYVTVFVINADRTLKEVGGFESFDGVDCGVYDREN